MHKAGVMIFVGQVRRFKDVKANHPDDVGEKIIIKAMGREWDDNGNYWDMVDYVWADGTTDWIEVEELETLTEEV